MRRHHLGVAVSSLDKAIAFYEQSLAYRVVSGPFDDPIQRVSVCFLQQEGADGLLLELISPLGEKSPAHSLIKRQVGAYHVCYEVDDVDEALAHLREHKCQVVGRPAPAVAFSGRRIAWCYTPTHQLIELLERRAA